MGMEENKATVRRFFTAMEQGDQAARREIIHPEFVGLHAPGGEFRRPGSPEAARGFGEVFREGLPDGQWSIDLLIAEGDYAVARWTFSVTHTGTWDGPLGHFPPTDRRVAFSGVNIYRFQDGKIIENWLHRDERHFLQQLRGEGEAAETAP